eukprot:11224646-Lingulodinium_polyedra.AAC.1
MLAFQWVALDALNCIGLDVQDILRARVFHSLSAWQDMEDWLMQMGRSSDRVILIEWKFLKWSKLLD